MKIFIKLMIIGMLLLGTRSYSTEITPLLGFRAGGELVDKNTNKKHTVNESESYGFIVSFPYEYKKTIEIYYSHQSSKLTSVNVDLPSTTGIEDIPLTIDYLHIGGTAPIADYDKLKTFISGGLGFTYLSPDLSGLQSDLRASFSIGLGLKWPITQNLALRLESRALATLFNSNSALFCNGGCSLTVNGSLFIQAEVFAGLAFSF
ncbi:MAG: hypothetical protein COB77_06150 [Gammaproteobacteria bacterium]|nr:MAG: hypothetical protein COB77_06150 [Gammaproteobacteria bacterium]